MGWKSRRRGRRWWHFALFGLAPILAGVAVLWNAILLKQKIDMAPRPEGPRSLKHMPWDEQLYLIELVLSSGLILGGVLASTAILSRRRR